MYWDVHQQMSVSSLPWGQEVSSKSTFLCKVTSAMDIALRVNVQMVEFRTSRLPGTCIKVTLMKDALMSAGGCRESLQGKIGRFAREPSFIRATKNKTKWCEVTHVKPDRAD
jgi:hypothetical protein